MGMADYMMQAIVREHSWLPIVGSVVQIGRQTFEQTIPGMTSMFQGYGLSLDYFQDKSIEVDRQTLQARQTRKPFVSDHIFFGALGVSEVHAVDFDDSEGADIIHDMNQPIPPCREATADLILDGSTLDNVYDPAMALMNYNRMLRPGGRVFSINAAKPDVHGGYTGMAPEWFLDYYAVNDYADCRVYVQLNFPTGPIGFIGMDYNWAIEHGSAPPFEHESAAFAIVVAEKGRTSTWERIPTRACFRTAAEQQQWMLAVKRFAASDRIIHLKTPRPELSPPPGFVNAAGTCRFSPA